MVPRRISTTDINRNSRIPGGNIKDHLRQLFQIWIACTDRQNQNQNARNYCSLCANYHVTVAMVLVLEKRLGRGRYRIDRLCKYATFLSNHATNSSVQLTYRKPRSLSPKTF